jgi:pyruvate dehydrogenase (quinone)
MGKSPDAAPTVDVSCKYVASVLDELADEDAMFFAATGTPCIWAARHIHYGAERRLFGSFTWASMANTSPDAFEAQLAFPGRQTIALCGDGGFTMLAMGDLLTEFQRRSPVIHTIFDNGMLDFVNIEQQEAGFVRFGTDFVNPDFSKVAEAYGARGIRIEEPGDVREGLQTALAHRDGPVVVDVIVARYALSLPSHVAFETLKDFTLSLSKQALSGKMDQVSETLEHNVGMI